MEDMLVAKAQKDADEAELLKVQKRSELCKKFVETLYTGTMLSSALKALNSVTKLADLKRFEDMIGFDYEKEAEKVRIAKEKAERIQRFSLAK